MTSPGRPEWAAEDVPEADAEPADAGVDHLADPEAVARPGSDGAEEGDGDRGDG